ncbi:MAG TPA: hypothetical protein VFA12_10375 [Stellaceae bacterium]|nr:hypothetical protein [Stellaceae bacterium]
MARLRTFLVASLLLAGLGSCSIIDNFSPRAVNFNLQAEQAQLQALLLNIVRASLNRPMQFTSLSTITGTQSMTGSASLLIPFGHHRPAAAASPDQLTPSTTISASPTFTVPVLDTQEFYQGELTPLTGQEYHFFVEEGYTPAQLLYLFANAIELKTIDPADPRNTANQQHFTFQNYVGSDFDFDQFAAVADYLLSLGMTFEQERRPQRVGPTITAAELRGNLRGIADVTNAGLHIMPVVQNAGAPAAAEAAAQEGPKPGPAGKRAAPRAKAPPKGPQDAALYQLEKTVSSYRPCFDPAVLAIRATHVEVDKSLVCSSNSPPDEIAQSAGNLGRSGGFYITELANTLRDIRARKIAELRAKGDQAAADAIAKLPQLPPSAKYQFSINTRSTEAILYYLGSVVARHLAPAPLRGAIGDGPRLIQVKVGEPYLPFPSVPLCPHTNDASGTPIGNYTCENLFVIEEGHPDSDAPLSVDYADKTWWIPADRARQGRTMRLVDLLKQLLALHTSAKTLPASSVLNIIGPAP